MMKILRSLLVASATFFYACSVLAGSGTVANHAVPIGKGAGVTGYGSAAPGTAGQVLTSNGPSADPTFQPSVGATSSTDGHITTFSGTGGKALQDQTTISTQQNMEFGSGKPWADIQAFGCKPDNGTTDNTTCLQNAINAVQTNVYSGVVYVPPGNGGYYCIKTAGGVTFSSSNPGMALVGASRIGSQLAACGVDTTVVTFAGTHDRMEHMQILGTNAPGSPGNVGVGSSHAAVVIASTAANVEFSDFNISGGEYAVEAIGADSTLVDGTICCTYGAGVAYLHGPSGAAGNSGGMWRRISIDQTIPGTAYPTAPYIINGWAASHTYAANDIINISGFLFQTKNGGTSGTTQPALQNYSINVTDGTATWQLMAPNNYSALWIDSGTADTYMAQMDLSGPYSASVNITNSFGTSAVTFFKCDQCLPSGWSTDGFLINPSGSSGTEIQLSNITAASGYVSGATALAVGANFTGKLIVSGGTFWGYSYGATLQAGGGAVINVENGFYRGASDAILATGSGTNIIGNQIGSGAGTGIATSGSMDYYNIIGNICIGRVATCVSDAATGTHKLVTGNW